MRTLFLTQDVISLSWWCVNPQQLKIDNEEDAIDILILTYSQLTPIFLSPQASFPIESPNDIEQDLFKNHELV